MKRIRIDVISDVVCPWCPIGFGRLEAALAELGDRVQPEVTWHPFELNPWMPAEGENLREHLAKKYGTTPEGSRAARAKLTRLGAEVGFEFRYSDEMRMWNTFQAHQLLHWAGEVGAQAALKKALFGAYFTRGENVSDPAVLLEAVRRAGLDAAEAAAVLEDARFAAAVRSRQETWRDRGVHGVPAILFQGRLLLSGAQPKEVFLQVLEDLIEEPDEAAA